MHMHELQLIYVPDCWLTRVVFLILTLAITWTLVFHVLEAAAGETLHKHT